MTNVSPTHTSTTSTIYPRQPKDEEADDDDEEADDGEGGDQEASSEAAKAAVSRLKDDILELHDGRIGELNYLCVPFLLLPTFRSFIHPTAVHSPNPLRTIHKHPHRVLGTKDVNIDTMTDEEKSEYYLKAKGLLNMYAKYRGPAQASSASSAASAGNNDLASVSGASSGSAKHRPKRRRSYTDNRPGSASASRAFGKKGEGGSSPPPPPPNSRAVRKAMQTSETRAGLDAIADAVRATVNTAKVSS